MLTIRISRRVAFLVVLGVVVAIPAGSWASHRFTDVPDTNIFHSDIGWLADAGITLGCNPPTNDEFCPSDSVTRAQMSAFMRRFAQYLDAEDGTPGFADTSGDANTLDGLDSSDIYTKTEADAAFVPHGEIVLSQSSVILAPNGGTAPPTVRSAGTGAYVSGDGIANLPLSGVDSLGGVEYDLTSFFYCISHITDGAFIDGVTVQGEPFIFYGGNDTTDRTAVGCYTVEVPGSGAHAYDVQFHVAGGGELRIAGTQTTWVPVDALP